ncbi:MAG: outer membrane protein transport protein [Alphaproteobacteria bacterium]|nr:outer membrane protein transport protein [Alphaproteobacteria bacterium]
MTTLLLTLLTLPAHATVPDTFGIGPANIGLAGAVTARADDPFAAFYNPAGLGQIAHPTVSAGVIRGQAALMDFQGIVYDTDADGRLVDDDGAPDYGPVGTDYRVWDPDNPNRWYLDGNQFGMAFPLLDKWLRSQDLTVLSNLRFTFGLATYLPTQTTLRMQMQDPYMPYYVMYRNRNDRFTLHPALGIHAFRGLYIGAGAQMMFATSLQLQLSSFTTAESFPSDSEEGGDEVTVLVTSNIDDFQLNLGPAFSPTAGFLFKPGELVELDGAAGDILDHTALGVSYRHEWKTTTNADVLVYANGEVTFDDETLLLSSLLSEPISIELADLVSLYNPPTLNIGLKTGATLGAAKRDSVDLSVDIDQTKWSKFVETTPPYQEMAVEALTGASVTIRVGDDYGPPEFKDTWAFRVGASWDRCWTHCADQHAVAGQPKVGLASTVRLGYAYIPSPVPDQTGRTNYMDSDRNVLAGGAGLEIHNRGVGPVRLDVGAQRHALATRTVNKDPDTVSDTDGDGILDYPRGYPLEGRITSGGSIWMVSVGAELRFGAQPGQERRLSDHATPATLGVTAPAEPVEPVAEPLVPADEATGPETDAPEPDKIEEETP